MFLPLTDTHCPLPGSAPSHLAAAQKQPGPGGGGVIPCSPPPLPGEGAPPGGRPVSGAQLAVVQERVTAGHNVRGAEGVSCCCFILGKDLQCLM